MFLIAKATLFMGLQWRWSHPLFKNHRGKYLPEKYGASSPFSEDVSVMLNMSAFSLGDKQSLNKF